MGNMLPSVLGALAATRPGARTVRLVTMAVVVLAAAGAAAQSSPTALTVRAVTGGIVTLAWVPPAAMPAPDLYLIDGGLVPGQTLVSLPTGRDTPAVTLQLQPGVYFARVRASVAGTISGPSNEVRIVVGGSEPPSAPAPLLGVVDGTSLALSWTPTFAGGEPAIVGLVVQGPVSGVVPLGLAETFEATNVPPGTYTIQVLAANAAGLSAPSNAVTLTVPAACSGVPGPPLRLIAERSGQLLTVSWEPPATGGAVTSYRLFVWSPADADGADLVASSSNPRAPAPAYGFSVALRARQVSGTLSPSWYTFTVQAENSCGAGAPSSPVTIIVP